MEEAKFISNIESLLLYINARLATCDHKPDFDISRKLRMMCGEICFIVALLVESITSSNV